MSRTFRRKELKAHFIILAEDAPHLFDGDEPRWKNVYSAGLTYDQYCTKATASFYSDKSKHNHLWHWPQPRWVTNLLQERPFRRESKRMILRALRSDSFDDLSIRRPKKDNYLY